MKHKHDRSDGNTRHEKRLFKAVSVDITLKISLGIHSKFFEKSLFFEISFKNCFCETNGFLTRKKYQEIP